MEMDHLSISSPFPIDKALVCINSLMVNLLGYKIVPPNFVKDMYNPQLNSILSSM